MPKAKPFPTEVALCAAFIKAVDKRTWTPYAETEGWDILLVRRADGFQIGVQAKLRFNIDVVNQAIDHNGHYYDGPMPDCRAVLVPETDAAPLDRVCAYIGLTVIRMRTPGRLNPRFNAAFTPYLPRTGGEFDGREWHEMAPTKRHPLPDYVPDVAAGAASPIQLTDWKVKALKIAVLLEERGSVSRADFRHLQIDPKRWLTMGWLKIVDGRFVSDAAPDFKRQHPTVFEKVRADIGKWAPAMQKELL